MAISYEDGLLEIDSFYSSPVEATPVDGAPETASVEEVGSQRGRQAVAHSPQIDILDEVHKHETRIPAMSLEARVPEQNEFSTLMDDIDQVVADDAAPSNPEGQPHFIVFNESADSPQHREQATKHNRDRISASTVDEKETAVDSSMCSNRDQDSSKDPAQNHSGLEEVRLQGQLNDTPIEQSSAQQINPQVAPAYAPIALHSLHAQKGLTLLSPRRGRSLDTLLSPQKPKHPEPQYSPLDLASLRDNRGLMLLTPRHSRTLEHSLMPDVILSPDMPSSGGKSSLIDEMREEEDRKRSRGMLKPSALVLTSEPDVIPVAIKKNEEKQLVAAEPMKNDEKIDLERDSPGILRRDSLAEAQPNEQNLREMAARPLEDSVGPSPANDLEDKDETYLGHGDFSRSVEELPDISNAMIEEDGKAATSHHDSRLGEYIVKDKLYGPNGENGERVPPQEARSKHNSRAESEAISNQQIPQGRSIRLQPGEQLKAQTEANHDSSDQSKPTELSVIPSKRARSSSGSDEADEDTNPASKTLRVSNDVDGTVMPDKNIDSAAARRTRGDGRRVGKRELKEMLSGSSEPHASFGAAKTRAQREEEARIFSPAEQSVPSPTTASGVVGGERVSKEMKSMLWGITESHVSSGPRKTRTQKEEEAKKVPNAGRAAKKKHERKNA